MREEEFVEQKMCAMHREVMDIRMEALAGIDKTLENRIIGIETMIEEVRTLQKTILYAIIFVAIGVCLTLFGVIVGRGFDLGWLHP
jgi:hypothetical protein